MDAQVVSSPKWIAATVALASLMSLPCGARAQGSWGGSLSATTDYVYRGISQTYGGAALQIGGSYQSPLGWFAGAWGSNVSPYPGGASFEEIDAYAGLVRALGADFAVKGTYTHYAYVNDPRRARYDYDEVAVSVAYLDLASATISYQPNYTSYSQLGFASRQPAAAYEITGRWPLKHGFALAGGAGYYDLQHLFGVGYWAGDLGVAYVYRRVTLDLSRFKTGSAAERLYGDASANREWVVSATWRF